jgi:hypothetical protein
MKNLSILKKKKLNHLRNWREIFYEVKTGGALGKVSEKICSYCCGVFISLMEEGKPGIIVLNIEILGISFMGI